MDVDEDMNFDREKREALRKVYEQAIKEGKDRFVFEGHDFLVTYTKYLLEWLDMKL